MAIPVYLWLYDDNGKLLKGSVDIASREGSIELTGMQRDAYAFYPGAILEVVR